MSEVKLSVPTYYGHRNAQLSQDGEDFGGPIVPVVVHEAEGIRIVLGSHDLHDDKADILLERRPGGWSIFLHPQGGGDPSGYICFLDDGRSFVQADTGPEATPHIRMLRPQDEIPELDCLPGETVS
ncbi:MAG: hypothetical protein AMXMBFR13_06840 [Phycisphaerae bacterium]